MKLVLSTLVGVGILAGSAFAQCGSKSSGDAMTKSDADSGVKITNVMHAEDKAAGDIVAIAAGNKDFSTLVTALKEAGLVETLKGKGPFTVFAPTNAAFSKLPAGALDGLLKDKAALTRVLTYHVVSGNVMAKDVVGLKFADTVSGQRATIDTAGGVKIAGVNVVTTDIKGSNGVIHVIDAVMMPASDDVLGVAGKAGSFKTLAAAIEAAGLTSTLQGDGPFTVFAPTDAAFEKLGKDAIANLLKPENREQLKSVLTYHVVAGRVFSDQALKAKNNKSLQGAPVTVDVKNGKPMVNKANLVTADINASNGVIHVIDTVLMPPAAAAAPGVGK
jgi:transforming growth factor-beta-induced protein